MSDTVSDSSLVQREVVLESSDPSPITLEEDTHLTVSASSKQQMQCVIVVSGGQRHIVEISVAEASQLHVLCIVNAERADVSLTQRSHVAGRSQVHWQNVTLGSGSVSQDIESNLCGDGARSDIDWMFYAKDSEKHTLNARNTFASRSSEGEITIRGVAEGTAHVTCNGMIAIGEEGTGTNAYLTEDVLMLDSTAKVDAIPGLEIKTNDVSASHSATVSKVTPEDLFYFASRGITEDEARRMYVVGFLGDLTQKIVDDSMREAVVSAIEGKYGDR